MKVLMTHRWLVPLSAALLLASVTGCSDAGTEGGQSVDPNAPPTQEDASGPEIGGSPDASKPTTEDVETDGTVDEDGGPGDVQGDAEEAGPTVIRYFQQELTGLSQDYVLKGGWAGETDRIVAVGNDGVVISRSPSGGWSVINEGEHSDLLNDIDGASSADLWAVGKNGSILNGSAQILGEDKPCEENAECDDGESCTLNTCVAGACISAPSGASGCCGDQVASYTFDDVLMDGWTVTNSIGGMSWQVVSYVDPATGQPRYTSAPGALYFGDPSKVPPNYDNGAVVGSVVRSPAITLPKTGKTTVGFQVFINTESGSSYDVLNVDVDLNGALSTVWSKEQVGAIPTDGFVETEADISTWNGKTVRLVFTFDSVDSIANSTEGIYIDDVVVDSDCSGSTEFSFGFPTLFGMDVISEARAYAVGLGGAIVTYDGLTWKSAETLSANTTWNGMYGAGDAIVVVGSGGGILVSDGQGLSMAASPTASTLWDVHSATGDSFWIVGENGTILRGSGGAFTQMSSPTTTHLRGVFATAADQAYAVGDGGVLLTWDGFSWSLVSTLPASVKTTNLHAIWVDATGLATITGDEGVLITGNQAIGFTYLGSVAKGSALNDLWGGDGVMVAVGDDSNLFRLTAAWGAEQAPSTQHLRSVWGINQSDIWAVGWAGLLLHWDGLQWTQVITNIGGSWEAVWGKATDDIYAAGTNGIIHWNGVEWSTVASQTAENLRAVYGFDGGDVWAVGSVGTIMHLGPFGWHQIRVDPIPKSDGSEEQFMLQLNAVWGATPDDVWAVGVDGGMVHWDGESWKKYESDFTISLKGLYGLAGDDIWAVGNQGFILHYDGEAWSPWPSGSVATLYDIHGDGDGHVVIVGDLGTVLMLREEPVEE